MCVDNSDSCYVHSVCRTKDVSSFLQEVELFYQLVLCSFENILLWAILCVILFKYYFHKTHNLVRVIVLHDSHEIAKVYETKCVMKILHNPGWGLWCLFQNLLREAGCAGKLTALLRAHEVAMRVSQQVTYPTLVKKVISTVNNLSVNDTNQKELQVSFQLYYSWQYGVNTILVENEKKRQKSQQPSCKWHQQLLVC